jgi:O-antigen/teichoic acid export membrane protein
MEFRSRRIFASFTWLVGAGAVAQLVQLPYAAFTSRVITPAEFGSYAAALTIATGVSLAANGGLNEAISRLETLEPQDQRGLTTWGIMLGLLGAAATWITAPLWARLFDNPESQELIRLLAISVLMTPYLAIAAGLSRRAGRFRQFALAGTLVGISGLALGSWAVWEWRVGLALAVPAVVSSIGMALLHPWYAGGWLVPGRARRNLAQHLHFGGRAVAVNVTEYLGVFLSQIGISRGPGSAALGQWNRAAVFSQMPIQLLTLTANRVLYPELGERWDREGGRTILGGVVYVMTWVAVSGALIWGAILVLLLPTFLGSGWDLAGWLAWPLSLAAGLGLAATAMTSALMAGNRFPSLTRLQFASSGLLGLSAVATLCTGNMWWTAAALPVAALLRYVLASRACRRSGYLHDGAELVLLSALATGALVSAALIGLVALAEASTFSASVGLALLTWCALASGTAFLVLRHPATKNALQDLRQGDRTTQV